MAYAQSNDLVTGWTCWRVLDKNTLALEMPNGFCCDCSGAIKVAKLLLPKVTQILAFSGHILDDVYIKTGKEWEHRSVGSHHITKQQIKLYTDAIADYEKGE